MPYECPTLLSLLSKSKATQKHQLITSYFALNPSSSLSCSPKKSIRKLSVIGDNLCHDHAVAFPVAPRRQACCLCAFSGATEPIVPKRWVPIAAGLMQGPCLPLMQYSFNRNVLLLQTDRLEWPRWPPKVSSIHRRLRDSAGPVRP